MAPIIALEIAERIVSTSFAEQQDSLRVLEDAARERRVNDVLLEVVADDAEPRPVRERALGRIVVQMSRAA